MSRLLDRRVPADRRVELAVALLLLAAGVLAVGFAVIQLADPDTQLLGLTLGLGALAAATALGIAGRLMVPQETRIEPRPEPVPAAPGEDVADLAAAGSEGISRGRLLAAAGGVAGASVVAAALAPLGSLAPADAGIGSSPWRAGTRLVGEGGEPIAAADVELGTFTTAFPEGADPRELGSPVVLVRLAPGDIHDRPEWAADGLVAYSKICTHAGCAVAMLRYGRFGAHVPRPALVCPCHYSTFDPADAGRVLFGPAGRALPQLPLRLTSDGGLEAAGSMSGPIGPSWWSVRRS
jgi:ubiquinol-cytochrome c reductase iron-sulfur subunit